MYRLIAIKKMKRVIFKTNEAVANHGGAMEADTISKHGRSSKSQMSRGISKFIAFLAFVVMLSACSQRLVDFTIISSKNHSLAFDLTQGKKVEGKSIGFLGMGATIKDAMDKALDQAGPGYDLLIDGVVYTHGAPFVSGFRVSGTAIRSRELRAYLGNEGFQKWLAENNVFDPEIAVVRN